MVKWKPFGWNFKGQSIVEYIVALAILTAMGAYLLDKFGGGWRQRGGAVQDIQTKAIDRISSSDD